VAEGLASRLKRPRGNLGKTTGERIDVENRIAAAKSRDR